MSTSAATSSFVALSRPAVGEGEIAEVVAALESGWLTTGPRVAAFEEAFARYVGASHALGLNSCTAALHLSLLAAGIGPGDEVITTPLTFCATANAIIHTGATPVFADVDPATANLTAKTIEEVRGPATRAIVLVHQGGMPAALGEIRALAAAHDLLLIEDAACALGSTYEGAPVGKGATLTALSFHPRKLVTTGEGGMLTTDDAEVAARARRLREHGMNVSAAERHASAQPVLERYLEVGFNYRMTDVQAAVGVVQLGKLDAMVARRRELARRYQALLAEVPGLEVATDPPYGTTNYQSFWVVLPDGAPVGRDEVLGRMQAAGVSCRRGIMAAHLEPAYAGHAHVPLPVTERLTTQSLILPLFHQLTEAEQDHVVGALREATGL